ncbi:StfH/YfcO family fimbrial adhesin [Salmonella enterica]|uniref:DUF2544 domain-containing protein n=1 Tax=Salmonella enterica subsp. salamae serovar 42:f,g,t:-- TaxID=41518 RepID=A0A737HE36_SALER|nr:StfH/YfcO family fimbrial adhesin [Salmonella enterica]EHI7784045.1 DUF2544 domain-containing protein [Salmonella enterica]KKA53837.1 membrane protein [Salmonella enterica subsp. salamae serovar 42:f,g,t:--]HAE8210931.1 DUF2544 domain-containing protein [Salmonella enterica subsp. salamae serovar 42:f,g,t:--]
MKILRILFWLFVATGAVSSAFAGYGKPMLKATFQSITLYEGIGPTGANRPSQLAITVTTPGEVSYGVWRLVAVEGRQLDLISWTGSSPAPTIVVQNYDNRSIPRNRCVNLPDSWDRCAAFTLNITVVDDDFGCPWLASTHVIAADIFTGETYSPPDVRSTVCPTVPLDTFDISWSPDRPQHDLTLRFDATGSTVTSTVHTYLLESNKLCDGSKMDTRSAYCRFVSTGITLNVLGCDKSEVTTSAVAHPITDAELHDINVSVNTKRIGSGQFSSTCSFQYILDEL